MKIKYTMESMSTDCEICQNINLDNYIDIVKYDIIYYLINSRIIMTIFLNLKFSENEKKYYTLLH